LAINLIVTVNHRLTRFRSSTHFNTPIGD